MPKKPNCGNNRFHRAHDACPGRLPPKKKPKIDDEREVDPNAYVRLPTRRVNPRVEPVVKAREAVRLRAVKAIPPAPPPKEKPAPNKKYDGVRRAVVEYNAQRKLEGPFEEQIWHELDAEGNATGYTEVRKRVIPAEDWRRCIAQIRRGEWTNNRCCRYAIKGGRNCTTHGGTLPTVKRAAAARLAAAADPAAARLIHIALRKRNVEDRDRIKAILAILDRSGISGAQTVEIEIKPWEAVLSRVAAEMSGGTDDNTVELVEGEDYTIADEEIIDDDD